MIALLAIEAHTRAYIFTLSKTQKERWIYIHVNVQYDS